MGVSDGTQRCLLWVCLLSIRLHANKSLPKYCVPFGYLTILVFACQTIVCNTYFWYKIALQTGWGTVAFLSLLMIGFAGHYYSFNGKYSDDFEDSFERNEVVLYIHIFCGTFACLFGPTQFLKPFREKYLNLHRWFGRIYAPSCIIGGITGFILAFSSYGGIVSHLGFGTLGIWWVITTFMAIYHIKVVEYIKK